MSVLQKNKLASLCFTTMMIHWLQRISNELGAQGCPKEPPRVGVFLGCHKHASPDPKNRYVLKYQNGDPKNDSGSPSKTAMTGREFWQAGSDVVPTN